MTLKTLSNKTVVTFIVSLALFMDSLDTTIINTAIPAMARSLAVNPVDLKIALISYLLSLAIFIPISGIIADKFGVKRVFIFALAVFTLSSFWCGYSHTLTQLIIARSVQGIGGSLMLPLGRLIILRSFERHELIVAMNHVIMVVSIGLMLGPFAGGLITDHLSWPWIFWVNIPVGLFNIVAAGLWLNDNFPRKSHPFDFLGFILFGGGLAVFTFSLSYLSESAATTHFALLLGASGILMLMCYFFRARSQRRPIIHTELFKIRTFRISVFGNLCARLGFGGVPFLLPLLLQIGLHYKALTSGLLLVPIAFGIIITKYVSAYILRFAGYKRMLLLNTILAGLFLWVFRIVDTETSLYTIATLTFIFGCLASIQYSGMNSLAYADISSDDQSAAISILSTIQQLSQSFGVAVCALFLRYYSTSLQLTPEVFHQTFYAMGALTILSALIFIRLKPEDGHQLLRKDPETLGISTRKDFHH